MADRRLEMDAGAKASEVSEPIWHDAKNPPDDSRRVMLRFDDDGSRDKAGFYFAFVASGVYVHSWSSLTASRFVYPIKWREAAERINAG